MMWRYTQAGIPDEQFYRGDVPMTKSEVRAVTISKMRLKEDAKALDIGSGSGSVTIEMALAADKGNVFAVERNPEGIRVLKENMEKFGVTNVDYIEGKAPDVLLNDTYDCIFIGGSGGTMDDLLDYSETHLYSEGRLVINCITIDSLYKAIKGIQKRAFKDLEVVEVGVSKVHFIKEISMLKANNPIFIIACSKK